MANLDRLGYIEPPMVSAMSHSIAQSEGERLTDYFGISTREMKDAIKDNNLCAPERRNAVMRQATLEMAAAR